MTTNNNHVIEAFYTAFAAADYEKMCDLYHPKLQFCDPVFGNLNHEDTCKMWQMLLKNKEGKIKIDFFDIQTNLQTGSAKWTAVYIFSKTNKKVVNKISSQFWFEDGLIIKQIDHFDLYKWSRQAFGIIGILLGWTPYFKNKIKKQALVNLAKQKD